MLLPLSILSALVLAKGENSGGSGGSEDLKFNNTFQNGNFQAALNDSTLLGSSVAFFNSSKGGFNFNLKSNKSKDGFDDKGDSKDNFDSFFKSSKSNNSFYAFKEGSDAKRFVMALVKTNDTNGGSSSGFLRFSVTPTPRVGVEWHHNGKLLNGTAAPDISHALRFWGMYESNSTYPMMTDFGNRYYFPSMNWSDITFSSMNVSGSQLITISSSATASDGLIFTINVHAQTDSANASVPTGFGLKYDIHINGSPTYKMKPATASSWNFIKTRHNSMSSSESDNSAKGNNVTQGAAYFSWDKTILLDGVNTTLVSNLNETKFNSSLFTNVTEKSSRDGKLDSYTPSKAAVSFQIPYFTSSMIWDPSIGVSDSVAASDYSSSNTGTSTSSNFAAKGSSPSGALVVALCAFLLF